MFSLRSTGCLVLVLSALLGVSGTQAKGEARAIEIDAVVSVSPEKAFDLWTNDETAKKFFSPDAKIDPTIGGRYEAIASPSPTRKGATTVLRAARFSASTAADPLHSSGKGRPGPRK